MSSSHPQRKETNNPTSATLMDKDTEYDPLEPTVVYTLELTVIDTLELAVVDPLGLIVVEGLFIEAKQVPTFPTLSTTTSSTSWEQQEAL